MSLLQHLLLALDRLDVLSADCESSSQCKTKGELADPDVWMRPAAKADGLEVCECVLVCSDGLIVIGLHCVQRSQHFKFKVDSAEKPEQGSLATLLQENKEAVQQ